MYAEAGELGVSVGVVPMRGLLPQTLNQACEALEGDAVVTAALGETLSAEFVKLKRDEALAYARHVSAWELERYGARF